ncbi:MAG TPA: bifunctional GNAT family N-acetyltransferase/acetate--CoA ligase family protein [Jiangellaceae bacterium]|nr:bifunctional GNAT family N-acetyltransferase/acetate--CoA ligase family protein [Jiangellaceae bacterium]
MSTSTYPAHWEADVVLSDGATAHVRPIRPDDADRLVAFYARVSDESKYYRFFAPYPQLSARDIGLFTHVDHSDRVALIMLAGDNMIAVGRYDRIDKEQAEVAFLVEDAHQGRGIGSVLLEHLAQAARENGIARFVAEVLPQNRKMIKVFADAGYTVGNTFEDGVVHVRFEIHPTENSLAVMTAREHRAEARSIGRLLTPRSVAVVGASRSREKVGQALVRNLVLGGFTGPVYAVNPGAPAIAGVPAYPSVAEIPGEVDLVVISVPAPAVLPVVLECASKGVKGLVVVSAGFAETGEEDGRARQAELVRLARANGMRVVGPNCLGIVNTDPEYSLNASLARVLPPPGRVGFFSQSGALGIAILETVAERGLGLATFVSAGNRADVSGNDLLQYWQDDPATDVVLLYLESIGNPRKFSRLARRVASSKPVVAVKSGRSTQGVPLGHAVRRSSMPVAALDAMFRQSGVVRVDTLAEMFDAAQVLAYQPLPEGRRVAVVGNSDSIGLLAADAADSAGLELVGQPRDLGPSASAADFEHALAETLDDPNVDSIIVVFVPTVESSRGDEVAQVLAATAGARGVKPIVTTFLGVRGVPEPLRVLDERGSAGRGSIPSYLSAEEAVRALAHATSYAAWRRRPQGVVPELDDCDVDTARAIVTAALDGHPDGTDLDAERLRQLLACYGITLLEMIPATTVDEAIVAGERLGWNVVLKATAPHLRFRPDLADVWRNIDTADEMRDAWVTMSRTLADPADARFVVQSMAPPGIPVVIRAEEDDLFGPVVSFGMSGVPTDLLGDRAYRIPPLTDVDAREMTQEIKAAPLLLGYHGGAVADLAAIEDLLHRVSRLTDDLPEVVDLALTPILAAPDGCSVVNGSATVAQPGARSDWYTRRLG